MFYRKSKLVTPDIGVWADYKVISHPEFPMVQECPHPKCWNYWNQVLRDSCPYCGTLIESNEVDENWKYKIQFTDEHISKQQGLNGLQWYKSEELSCG